MTRAGLPLLDGARFEISAIAGGYEAGFRPGSHPTVGIEEELILVEPAALDPVESIDAVLEALGDRMFVRELRTAQIELTIPPRLTVSDLCRELASGRARLVDTLRGEIRAMAAGTHPLSTRPVVVTDSPRYRMIGESYEWATRRGLPSGLHVHVAVDDPVDALAVYNGCRAWLPELSALAANSPFFEGIDSGLATSRLKLSEDFPRSGIPPAFASWEDLAGFVAWGMNGKLFPDPTFLWWDLRLRPEYGTLEFRFADAQTSIDATAAITAVCQSLVAALRERLALGEQLSGVPSHVLNENRWRAIRDGLEARLADPLTGAIEPVRDRLARLLGALEPHASACCCADELALAWTLLDCNGAIRQRAIAEEHGMHGLLEWLVDQTEQPTARVEQAGRVTAGTG
jgi:carboxylate-amine ligase